MNGELMGDDSSQNRTSARGFASMDPKRQREIARRGGKAAHAAGHAHRFSTTEAREAGRKGGKSISQNRAHMAEIGRKGGEARRKKAAASATGSLNGRMKVESDNEELA